MAFNMGMLMSNSLLALYADHLGASAAVIGLVISSFGVSSILLRFIAAPVIDTYNRKYLVVLAAVLMSAAFWGFCVSTTIPMLVCFRMLQGCAMVLGNACCLAMVAEILPKEKYNSGIGYFTLASVISQAVGPVVGLELVKLAGFRVTYAFAASLMLLAAFLALMIKIDFKRTAKLQLSLNRIFAKEAVLPSIFLLVVLFCGSSVNAFLYLYAAVKGITGNIGLYFTVTAATILIARPLAGKITDKYGLIKIAIPSVLCSAVGFFIISRSATLTGLIIAAFFSAIGQGAFTPSVQALAMKSVPNERRGAASSTCYVAQDIGMMTGSFVSGLVVQTLGYTAFWHSLMIPYIISAVLLILFRKSIVRIDEEFASR